MTAEGTRYLGIGSPPTGHGVARRKHGLGTASPGLGADNCDRKADTDAEDLQLFHPDEIFSKPCSPGMERRGLRASSTGRRY